MNKPLFLVAVVTVFFLMGCGSSVRECAQIPNTSFEGTIHNTTFGGESDIEATLSQDGCELTGFLRIYPPLLGSGPINGAVVGDYVLLTIPAAASDAGSDLVFTGVITESGLRGSYTAPNVSQEGEWDFVSRAKLVGAQRTPTPAALPSSTGESNDFDSVWWDYVNRLLGELYGLPPVENVNQLQSAAFLVSRNWFEVVDKTVKKLENQGIEWSRVRGFCYLFDWYIKADIRMRDVSTPLDFVAAEDTLVERVRGLDESADSVIEDTLLGEPRNTYPTEDACVEGFIE